MMNLTLGCLRSLFLEPDQDRHAIWTKLGVVYDIANIALYLEASSFKAFMSFHEVTDWQ